MVLAMSPENRGRKPGWVGGVSVRKHEAMRKDDTMTAFPLFASATLPVAPLSADARVHLLNTEHGDLDAAIAALSLSGNADDLTITRLKKRKLQIKDEIAAILSAAIQADVAKAS
jgi:hypothetical protein